MTLLFLMPYFLLLPFCSHHTIYVRLAVREDWMGFVIVPLSVACMRISSYPWLVSRLLKGQRFFIYKSQIYHRPKRPMMTRMPTMSVSSKKKKTATNHLTLTLTSLQASNDPTSYLLNPRLLLDTTLDIIQQHIRHAPYLSQIQNMSSPTKGQAKLNPTTALSNPFPPSKTSKSPRFSPQVTPANHTAVCNRRTSYRLPFPSTSDPILKS